MPLISCVINVDTRSESNSNKQMFNGVVSRDFLFEGVKNKIKLFENFDTEIIVFVDEHELLSDDEVNELRRLTDSLIIRKHNKDFEDIKDFAAFNDFNYLQALFQARGKYIFHFDGDVAAFAPSNKPIEVMLAWLETYDYISYPSHWSPNPIVDDSFDHWWISTRYFCCKRKTLNFSEIIKCQLDYDYWCRMYPVKRKCHWLEHLLGSISKYKGKGVFYPPVSYDDFILFVWENYRKGLLKELNEMSYEEVKSFVLANGGLQYPNNLTVH